MVLITWSCPKNISHTIWKTPNQVRYFFVGGCYNNFLLYFTSTLSFYNISIIGQILRLSKSIDDLFVYG